MADSGLKVTNTSLSWLSVSWTTSEGPVGSTQLRPGESLEIPLSLNVHFQAHHFDPAAEIERLDKMATDFARYAAELRVKVGRR